MRPIRLVPLALIALAAACSDTAFDGPVGPDDSDDARYQQEIEGALLRDVPITPSPELSAGPLPAMVPPPAGVEALTNGSFETGDFTGWTAVQTAPPFRPWAVSGAGAGGGFGMAVTLPQDGSRVAWNGFDGLGPMDFVLDQVVSIPSGVATLSWEERLQWNFNPGFVATEPRTHTVELQDPNTSAVLATLHTFSTGTQAQNPIGDTGWQSFSADVSAFAGQTVRLVFRQHIPQRSTGPAQFELDHVHLVGLSVIPVEVDIKPGSDPNSVNTRARGVLPVAILTTADFDAAEVDPSTVTLGDDDGNDTSVAERGRSGRLHASLEDVDGDGDADLILKFSIQALVANGDLTTATTELFLNGSTAGGDAIGGSDAVNVVR